MIPRGLPVFPHGAVLVDLQPHLTGEQSTRLALRLTGRYGGRLGVLTSLGGQRAWVELVAAPDGPLAAVTGWGGAVSFRSVV